MAHSLCRRSPAADPLGALTHEPALYKGRASEKPHWIFKVQFFSIKVTIFALTYRFKAHQYNHDNDQNLKVSHDLTKLY